MCACLCVCVYVCVCVCVGGGAHHAGGRQVTGCKVQSGWDFINSFLIAK